MDLLLEVKSQGYLALKRDGPLVRSEEPRLFSLEEDGPLVRSEEPRLFSLEEGWTSC